MEDIFSLLVIRVQTTVRKRNYGGLMSTPQADPFFEKCLWPGDSFPRCSTSAVLK